MQLQAREKRMLILGGIVATLLLAYLLWPRSTPRETSVELVSADKRPGAAAPTPSQAATPPPVAAATPQAVPAQPAPAAPASGIPEGLKLTGVSGRSAIFSFGDGSQRLVARGRDVAPGVTLQSVHLRDVVLVVGQTNYRLGFGGAAIPMQPVAATPAATTPAPVAVPVVPVTPTPPAPTPTPAPSIRGPSPPAPSGPRVVMPAPPPNAGPR